MKNNSRAFAWAGAVLLVVLARLSGPVRADIIEQILVKVNGEIFTKSDLEERQVSALRQMGQDVNLKNNPTDAQLRKMLDDITPDLIVSVVDEILVVQRGRELGYRLTDEQFTSYLENVKKDSKIETEEQFQAALKQEGMTLADLRKNIEKTAIVSRVQQNEVLGRIAVSEDEGRRYYDAHLKDFTTPQAITLREIFVSVPGDGATINVGLDEEAREKAGQIRQRALSGESFETLASEVSDAPSRANAGLIGPLNLTDLSADLQKLVGGMKVGDVTEVLRAQRGYQLLKLESSSVAETMPFEQAKEQISDRVFNEKRRAEFEKYLTRLRAEAIIDWKNAEIKKAYELGLERIKSGAAGSR